jgi:peptide/nickel transport system permease protein
MLVIVSAVVFTLFYVFPSADQAALRAGRGARPEDVDRVRETLGLNDSKPKQFCRYMVQVFTPFDACDAEEHGGTGPMNLGISVFQSNTPVREIIFHRLPATIMLVVGSVFLWLLIAIPVGIISAVRRRTLLDRSTMTSSLVLISAPIFVLGLTALYLFANEGVGIWPILPGQGGYSDANSFFGKAQSMILPWFVLAFATAAIYARYLRSQMIDVLSEDYIRTARSKGVSERRVILKHALRSAITPLVTLLGLDIGILLAGNAILTETVFVIPGVGKELANSIIRTDFAVIQGIVLFGAFFIIVFNLIVDILYAFLDPRVRYQ